MSTCVTGGLLLLVPATLLAPVAVWLFHHPTT